MMDSYVCACKKNSNQVMKGSGVKTKVNLRKEYIQVQEEGWKTSIIFRSFS